MDNNSRFLLKSFRKYYKENRPIMPDRFTKREFGFMFFDRQMVQRHMGFPTPEELTKFMISQVPSHSYYSTAYYRKPSAPTMEEKEWLGADLIFDLDADHLEGADKMTYSEMLGRIKKEMMNLTDSFLFSDLGFDEKTVHITFSGGRGYHAHIPSKDILTLGTFERRELVDYITCTGLNIDWVFPYQRVATSQVTTAAGSRTNVAKDRLIPPPDAGGWKRRMREGLKCLVDEMSDLDPKELKKKYPALANYTVRNLMKIQEEVRSSRKMLFEKNTMAMLNWNIQELLVKIMGESIAPTLAAEVDKPVTPDIKRIIRLPGSVHGKTGLRVTPLTRNELDDFEPLRDAVPSSYSDDPTKITLNRKYEFDMKGEHFSLSGETEVPEYAAVFLVGRRVADYGYLSEKKESIF